MISEVLSIPWRSCNPLVQQTSNSEQSQKHQNCESQIGISDAHCDGKKLMSTLLVETQNCILENVS